MNEFQQLKYLGEENKCVKRINLLVSKIRAMDKYRSPTKSDTITNVAAICLIFGIGL